MLSYASWSGYLWASEQGALRHRQVEQDARKKHCWRGLVATAQLWYYRSLASGDNRQTVSGKKYLLRGRHATEWPMPPGATWGKHLPNQGAEVTDCTVARAWQL